MSNFGLSLRQMLEKKKVSVTDLSKNLSIPMKSVQEWTQNNRFPRDPDIIRRIAEFLDCSVYALMFGVEDPRARPVDMENAVLHVGKYEIKISKI